MKYIILELLCIGAAFAHKECSERFADPGWGPGGLKRYSYDKFKEECVRFTYRGFAGSDNNYKTHRECTDACYKPCKQVPYAGIDPLANPTYYAYDAAVDECVDFQYSGVGGNHNRFPSKDACENKCLKPCYQKAGVVGSGLSRLPHFTYNQTADRCEPFYYSGLGGNKNNFRRENLCQSACYSPCYQPAGKTRYGVAHLNRYTYDHAYKRCKMFHYLGTYGNENNFLTKRDCRLRCEDPCQDPARVGEVSRLAAVNATGEKRFSYISKNNTCEEFKYDGKSPRSLNSFKSWIVCMGNCHRHEPCSEHSKLSVHTTCNITHYTYEALTDECLKVPAGRCPVGANAFHSESHCKDVCLKPCGYPAKVNDKCPFTENRYSYNSTSLQCERFAGCVYGNQNNFRTLGACEQKCYLVK